VARIAIVGAGNLGAFFAAHLALASHEVFYCCTRRPVPVTRVEGLPDVNVPFYFQEPPPADLVLLTVKAQDTGSALGWLAHLCSDGRPVAVIQNGVHHADRIAPYTAIPVLSYVYVESDGERYRAFEPPRAHLTVPAGPASQALIQAFAGTSIRVHEETSFHRRNGARCCTTASLIR
jgi:2-dehydropantoate 2-reductase